MEQINRNWLEEVRPVLEAFFDARYFLEMIVQYRRELEGLSILFSRVGRSKLGNRD